MYAWSSLGFTLAVFSFYLISVFGWPPGLENHSEYIINLLWKVIGITFLAEFVLDLLKSTKFGGVHKDERDILIESKGFRNAYYFLIIALIILVVNILISDVLSTASGEAVLMSEVFMIFHVLVFILFIANIIKSATQVVFYQKGI